VSSPFRFSINRDYDGSRLDRFLIQKLGFSSSLAQKSLRKGWVRVNGKRAKPLTRLKTEDEVRLTKPGLTGHSAPDKKPSQQFDEALLKEVKASILEQDDEALVVVKHSGMVIHKGTNHSWGLVDVLAAITGSDFLAPIGRLDRDASGLLVFARSRASARVLDQALRENRVSRTYTVLAYGQLKSQVIRERLQPGTLEKGKEKTVASEEGLESVSHVVRRKDWPQSLAATLAEVTIETGRTHQIRAHLASLGHPLLGDPRYRSKDSEALDRKLKTPHLLLHAGEISFPDPLDEKSIKRFRAPSPAGFERTLSALRKSRNG
jgi:23S rRNA pseudouridine955/2504/2580 synthase